MSTRDLLIGLQRRLRALDEEREAILGMLRLYGAPARNADGRTPLVRKRRARSTKAQRAAPFDVIPGGPTDSIIRVLASATDGLTYSDLVDGAARIVKTTAKDPRATVAASIHSLRKRARIELREDRYYIA